MQSVTRGPHLRDISRVRTGTNAPNTGVGHLEQLDELGVGRQRLRQLIRAKIAHRKLEQQSGPNRLRD